MGRFAVLVWVALTIGIGQSSAQNTFKLVSYNVENYNLADRLTPDGFKKNYPKPESEKAALREILKIMGADVLVLQEMGGADFQKELQRDLKAEGCNYPYAALVSGPDEDRHVAALSKTPFKRVVEHRDLPFIYFGRLEKVKRGLLEIAYDTPRGELAIFVVHLKSKFTDREDDPQSALRRLGESEAVRDRVLARVSQTHSAMFVLIGDMNDTRDSPVLKMLTRRGHSVLTEPLPATDTRGETWTHYYRKEDSYSRIDFALAAPGLLKSGSVSATLCDHPLTLVASDHRPLMLTFAFPVQK